MLHQHGDKAGLPIVDVHHIRTPMVVAREMCHRLRKENEPLGIVLILLVVLTVQRRPIVVARMIHKVDIQILSELQGGDAGVVPPAVHRRGD